MQKRWIVPGLLAAAFAFAATGLANNGDGHGNGHGKKFGPYGVVTDDHGSCGNAWAVDTELRTFTVKRNHDGTFTLTRRDHGACETHGRHGSMVPAGKTGRFRGYLRGTISGGTFDPNATCPANCGDTDVFIATFFGTSATFSCFTDSRDCKFNYQYHAPRQGLRYHHWYDKGKGAGTMLNERFRGDIAAS
jgi:hypothetical protein